MSMLRQAAIVFVLCLYASLAIGQGVDRFDGATQERYHALIAELRCVVCQNRTIAESDAPLAADLRLVVQKQIEAGASDREIKAYLVDRYGDWILYDPPVKTSTLLLWGGPFVLLAIGLLLIVALMRRRKDALSDDDATTLSAQDQTRLNQILAEDRPGERGPF